MAAILVPGRTCWRLDRADRASCIQDAADYFRLVREAMLRAERTIFILGWDLSARTNLVPGKPPEDAPALLDDLLRFIAKRRPRLRCYVLTWDYGSLYVLERDPLTRFRFGWRMPRNVTFGFDDHHPFGASHHQKVVVVDDRLAFSGSIDLTGHRWDRSEHRLDDPDRVTPTGKKYDPYHEVQAVVEGDAAAALGQLARDRWRALGAPRLPAIAPAPASLWPRHLTPDFENVTVGISRTVPGSESEPPARECEALFIDSMAAAKRYIYIENQYFASTSLAEKLAVRLTERDGPEVIVSTPRECFGWLEKNTMGALRDEVFRILRAADRYGRLRLVQPMASRARGVATFIHSKVMVIDDEFLRIGSANLNNRSLGMDTECDLSIEAGDGDVAVRKSIRSVLARLLAEHFGVGGDELEGELRASGAIRNVIDSRQNAERTLEVIPPPVDPVDPPPEAVQATVDPEEPLGFGATVGRLLPVIPASSDRSPLRLYIIPATVILAAAIVAWGSRHPSESGWMSQVRDVLLAMTGVDSVAIVAGAFVVAAWCLVPLELCILGAAFTLGPMHGGVASTAGALVAAGTMYVAGRWIGPAALSRWVNPRVQRLGRKLSGNRTGAVAALRLATLATSSSIHLLCGAGRVPFANYFLGTVIGLAPPILLLSALGGLLRWTLFSPTIRAALITVALALGIAAATFALRMFLLIRQFAPVTAAHRSRAEFG